MLWDKHYRALRYDYWTKDFDKRRTLRETSTDNEPFEKRLQVSSLSVAHVLIISQSLRSSNHLQLGNHTGKSKTLSVKCPTNQRNNCVSVTNRQWNWENLITKKMPEMWFSLSSWTNYTHIPHHYHSHQQRLWLPVSFLSFFFLRAISQRVIMSLCIDYCCKDYHIAWRNHWLFRWTLNVHAGEYLSAKAKMEIALRWMFGFSYSCFFFHFVYFYPLLHYFFVVIRRLEFKFIYFHFFVWKKWFFCPIVVPLCAYIPFTLLISLCCLQRSQNRCRNQQPTTGRLRLRKLRRQIFVSNHISHQAWCVFFFPTSSYMR